MNGATAICDFDCFNCQFADCINDELQYEDYKQSSDLDFNAKRQNLNTKQYNKRKYNKNHYEKYKEIIKANSKAYYIKNNEAAKAYRKAYYEKNKDRFKAYYKKNKKGKVKL